MKDKTNSFGVDSGMDPAFKSCASKDSSGPLLSRKEAAAYLGLAQRTLAIWAVTGRYGLQMVKIGRLAKYRKSTLDNFINERTKG